MACVYILHSEKLNRYYIGSCNSLDQRFLNHLNHKYKNSFTSKSDDWVIFLKVDGLEYHQVRNVEKHIKKMKSKKYIENLKLHPEMLNKLIERFCPTNE